MMGQLGLLQTPEMYRYNSSSTAGCISGIRPFVLNTMCKIMSASDCAILTPIYADLSGLCCSGYFNPGLPHSIAIASSGSRVIISS